jgi:hypothetical protein
LRDLAIAQSLGNERQDLVFARGNSERIEGGSIDRERLRSSNDYYFFRARQLEAEPDSKSGKYGGDDPAVDLERMLDEKVTILDRFEQRDQRAAEQSI